MFFDIRYSKLRLLAIRLTTKRVRPELIKKKGVPQRPTRRNLETFVFERVGSCYSPLGVAIWRDPSTFIEFIGLRVATVGSQDRFRPSFPNCTTRGSAVWSKSTIWKFENLKPKKPKTTFFFFFFFFTETNSMIASLNPLFQGRIFTIWVNTT